MFENTINKYVTSDNVYRNNTKRAFKLSPYQLINNIMKKNILIGVPVFVIAVVTMVLIAKSPDKGLPLANDNLTSGQKDNIIYNNLKELEDKVKNFKEDNSSIDAILASFDNDAESDALISEYESSDVIVIMDEIENYNNIKTNSYEKSI
jgi:hypothetical protein